MEPFVYQQSFKPNIFERILRINPKKNFLIDLNNYLTIVGINDLKPNPSADKVTQLASVYNIKNPYKDYYSELLDICQKYTTYILNSPDSNILRYAAAQRVHSFLHIKDEDFESIAKPMALLVFRKEVFEYLQKYIHSEEKDKEDIPFGIVYISSNLEIDKENVELVTIEIKKKIIENMLIESSKDRKISPEEESEVASIAKAFKVNLELSEKSKTNILKFKKLWNIENGELEEAPIDILLQKNEKCYFASAATLYEKRIVTKSVGYAGPTLRIKIAKGLYYRVGNFATQRNTEEVMSRIDIGILYITSKRILFIGDRSRTIKYSQILDLELYTDGVEIIRDSGKPQLFEIHDNDSEIAIAIIAKQIQDN